MGHDRDGAHRGPRGPNAERRAATREKILAAAVRCLNGVGYALTSTVRVAAEADVARGSLLHQFPTRIDLILAVADFCTAAQRTFIRDRLRELPQGRERFVGSVSVNWEAFQQPELRALLEIITATRHDPELATRIPDFAQALEAGISRGAKRSAERNGLVVESGEAEAERRLLLVALRGLAVQVMLSGAQADPEAVIALLSRRRGEFYDSHLPANALSPVA